MSNGNASGTGEGSSGSSGGAANSNQTGAGGEGSGGSGGAADTVPKAELERVLGDMHRFKGEARASAAKIAELEAAIKAVNTKKAEDGNDYKALYESAKGERDQAAEKNKSLQKAVFTSERHRAAYPELKKAGFREDVEKALLPHLNFDEIEVEVTSTGRIICNGVAQFVEKVKSEYAFAFEAKKAPTVNGGGGAGTGDGTKVWTPQTIAAIEMECRKKGDMTPYREAVKQYNAAKVSKQAG